MSVDKRQTTNDKREKIQSFTDLRAWKEAHTFAVELYKATKQFPKDEMFALTSQMRRSAVSVTSNIAEGYSRKTASDKEHFYVMARGSLSELQSQLLIARDVGYMTVESFQKLASQSVVTHKILNGLVNATKEKLNG
ncbi:MAG: four helix bundle protein [Candidatus Saccharimonadales bacterium]